jgi:hypothetical protein
MKELEGGIGRVLIAFFISHEGATGVRGEDLGGFEVPLRKCRLPRSSRSDQYDERRLGNLERLDGR